MIQSESHFIKQKDFSLHFRRFFTDVTAPSVMLVHGSIEDGRIFYSKSGKGLAPFLAENGYDVFVPDMRGKGKSTPAIDKNASFGQYEGITEDMSLFLEAVEKIKGNKPKYLMAHSWGGVISLSYLARNEYESLKGLVFFGSKRDVRVQNFNRWLNIDLLWNTLGNILVKRYGYFPAKKFKAGSADESKNFFLQVNNWVYAKNWIDEIDGFNYAEKLKEKKLPPILSITGAKDTHAGHPKDVKRLLAEIGNQANHEFKVIGKRQGYAHDYDHINLLTHPKAKKDHFKEVLEWLRRH